VNTAQRIVRFINSVLLNGAPITIDPLAAGLLDSMMLEQLVGFIEDEFEIRFSDDDLQPEHFKRMDTLVALVESRRGSAT
jgi:acyl carrier protein